MAKENEKGAGCASISEELKLLDDVLMEIHERIRSGRCLTNKQQARRALDFLHMIANKDEGMSKYQAENYVGVSRATFDRLVASGELPRGKKKAGFTELFWYGKDLDPCIDRLRK